MRISAKIIANLCLVVLASVLCSFQSNRSLFHAQNKTAAGSAFTAVYKGSCTANPATTQYLQCGSTLSIALHDTIALVIGYQSGGSTPSTITCGSNTLTQVKVNNITSPSGYNTELYLLQDATSAGSCTPEVDFTPSYANYEGIAAANWSGVPTNATVQTSCNSAGCNTIGASSANRTSQNIVVSNTTVLLIGIGLDWDGSATYNATTNGYTLRVGGGTNNTPFIADKEVTSSGTYPNGNFASTSSAAQQYLSFFIALSK